MMSQLQSIRQLTGALLLACLICLTSRSTADDSNHDEPFRKIAVIGASASAGFGVVEAIRVSEGKTRLQGVTLSDVLVESARQSDVVVLDLASGGFFTRPLEFGKSSVQRAVAWKPDLVVGVDFLFWYVYGGRNHADDPENEKAKRLEGLEQGLAVLELVKCPLVIGEIPDMSLAIGGMLSKRQVPSLEAMKAVNERIHDWADSHANVAVVPLFDLIESLRNKEAFTIGEHAWPAPTDDEPMMLPDNLHPNLRGLVALIQSIQTEAMNTDGLKERMPTLELDRAILIAGIRDGTEEEVEVEVEETTSTDP
ncbi:MAG: SGNH/GDSL hydrolase family protein [Phycisphaerales bacterium]|nr:SGNH/GDSL hydrolase family protein [Phycisphaerales bacterium]